VLLGRSFPLLLSLTLHPVHDLADATSLQIPLRHYFPEYEGGSDLQKATKYILWKYMQENRAKMAVYPQ
jgi:guanine nucleotide-binding protein subunit alpha